MDTVRAAIQKMARSGGNLGDSRAPGSSDLHRRCQDMHKAAALAIDLTSANGLNPDRDEATQHRLAAAVERQLTVRSTERQSIGSVASAISSDFNLQEAAAKMLLAEGSRDPLGHLADPESKSRADSSAPEILARHNISAGKALRTASKHDMNEVAAGRYDKIQSEHTRFAVGTILGLSDEQMNTPIARAPEAKVNPGPRRPFPAMGLGKGPAAAQPVSFGRKMVSAER